ncbi:MAG: 4,5-dihydroxyphthalate decarboxylase [Gammaproteobacteria bacterium]|jgi:4,5-dihydroxyphthalate decarboxylase
MPNLSITAAFADYDRTVPLRTGDVRAEGIDLRMLTLSPTDIFRRMCQGLEFDASEMSMGAHLYLCGAGDSPFVAMPAFPSRAFRHSMVYAHVDAGIDQAQDLNGKRIAIREWGMTAVVWIVGILAEEHGLDVTSVDWVAALPPRVPIPMPQGAKIRYLQAGENMSDLLDSGQIDALLTHQVPQCFAQGSPRVKRVFADYVQAEREFYQRTKLHPIMHCAVLRRDIYERNRWALRSLYVALCDARDHAAKEILKTGTLSSMIPFLPHAMDDAREMFGDNWWPYGLDANYECIARMARYAFEQGLTPRVLQPEELFEEIL